MNEVSLVLIVAVRLGTGTSVQNDSALHDANSDENSCCTLYE